MAEKRPLVNYAGAVKELAASDTLPMVQTWKTILVHSLAGTNILWTNMPAAITWLNGVTNSRPIFYLDLTDATEIQVVVTMNGALGATNAKICLRYRLASSAFSIWATDYTVMGASSAEVYGPIGSGGGAATSTGTPGSITTIEPTARTLVWVGCMGIDGDATADPNIGHIMFRYR